MRSISFPSTDVQWQTGDPAALGWDAVILDDLTTFLEQHQSEQFVLTVDGRILLEKCWGGATPSAAGDVASIQKSVISVALACLVEQGRLALEEPVTRWLGRGWTRTSPTQEDAITLRHVATMCSGLYDDFSYEAEPGTIWYYNNNGYHQVRKVIERATGLNTQDVCRELLFEPLGMAHSEWELRPKMLDPAGWRLSGLRASARDLVRVGLLVLAGGQWGDHRVVEDSESLAAFLRPSQALNPSYGVLWWLPTQPWARVPRIGAASNDPRKAFGGVTIDHPLAPSGPADLKAANGAGGQRLYLSESMGVVMARRGRWADDKLSLDEEVWRRLMAAAPESRRGQPA